ASVRDIYDRVVCAERPGVFVEVRQPISSQKDTRLERFIEAGGVVDDRLRDLFEHSAYFGDQLLRYPDLVDEIGKSFDVREEAADSATLRRFYRRQMLRIQSESMQGAEIFETLGKLRSSPIP